MRTVGHRKTPAVTFFASADALADGGHFNDSMRRLAPDPGHIPKGVYFFKTHEEANQFDLDCLAKKMARIAQKRNL
jgi:hypothetical protein